MAQRPESKEERPLQSFSFKEFLAVNTTNSRIASPPNTFYQLENAQPIGAANLHSIFDISTSLANFGADTPYVDASVNISNTEYLIVATTTGKLFSYNIGTQALTQINGASTLSGSTTRIIQWQNSQALIIDGNGYFNWNGTGNIVSIGGATGAPTAGTAIAVYQNRVWISAARVLYFSAPASFTDFTQASGGGTSTLTDSTLRSNVTALLAANGYLYVFGNTSVDAISDLYIPLTSSGAPITPPTPNFTKINLSAIVGTDHPYTIFMYGRLVIFANHYGVWSLYGTAITSISSPDPNNTYQSAIDGTWQYLDFNFTISGGQVITRGLLNGALLIKRLNDPVFGSNVVIAMYQGNSAGGKWWFANYGGTGVIQRITTGFSTSAPCEPALFAYIGNKLYQLFANSSSAPPATIKTPLWDFGDPITQKEVIRAGIAVAYASGSVGFSMTLDTQIGSQPINVPVAGQVQWINNASQVVPWQNNLSNPVIWINSGILSMYWAQAPQGYAKWVGLTVTTVQGFQFEIDAFLLDYKWSARWVGN